MLVADGNPPQLPPPSSTMAASEWIRCCGAAMMDGYQHSDVKLLGENLPVMRIYFLSGVLVFQARRGANLWHRPCIDLVTSRSLYDSTPQCTSVHRHVIGRLSMDHIYCVRIEQQNKDHFVVFSSILGDETSFLVSIIQSWTHV